MTREEMELLANLTVEKLSYGACPECGAIQMRCAKRRGEYTCCGVTDRPIKPSGISWEDWLRDVRGDEPSAWNIERFSA